MMEGGFSFFPSSFISVRMDNTSIGFVYTSFALLGGIKLVASLNRDTLYGEGNRAR